MEITLEDAAYDTDVSAALIEELQQEYIERYGGRDATPIGVTDFAAPHGVFVIAMADDQPVGCAALRRYGDGVIEIKRMFVRRSHRRQGHGRSMLRALEDRARRLGYRRVILETGAKQPEALALYSGAGYHRIPNFGYYRDWAFSRCFAKDL